METTSKRFAEATNGDLIESERPKTVIRNSKEIVILGDVDKKFELFLRVFKNFKGDGNVEGVVKVFVSPMCPVCPRVVEEVCTLPVKRIEIIDVTDYPDLAEDIMATPTVVVGKAKLVGAVSKDEVMYWLENFDRKEYFAKLLKEGSAEDVVREVLKEGNVEELVDLLTYGDFMVRLGAMVALEELAKVKPDVIESVKDKIRMLLKHEDERIRQDIAMLLGDIGDSRDKEFLKELIKEGGEVEESAREAMEKIDEREK